MQRLLLLSTLVSIVVCATHTYVVSVVSSSGSTQPQSNPYSFVYAFNGSLASEKLTFYVGQTYIFDCSNVPTSHQFYLTTAPNGGGDGVATGNGITNNAGLNSASANKLLTWKPQKAFEDVYYYGCKVPQHLRMGWKISVTVPYRGLGTNLEDINDFSSNNWAIVDVFKTSRDWISGNCNTGTWDDGRAVSVDANGWPTSLLPNQCLRTVVLLDTPDCPKGNYTMTWEGEGTFTFLNAQQVLLSENGRIVFEVKGPANAGDSFGTFFFLTSTGSGANYAKNIKIKHQSQLNNNDIFHPYFLENIKHYNNLRFMDMQRTNFHTVSSWDNRAKMSDARWSTDKGLPLEALINLANTLNVDPWFCIPHLADDNYVTQFATVVKNQLNSNLKPFVEYSNEFWNSIFPTLNYCQSQAQANTARFGTSGDNFVRFYATRTRQVHTLWSSVWGGSSGFVRILAGQSVNPGLLETGLEFEDNYKYYDAIAVAPYFGHGVTPSASTPLNQAMDWVESTMEDSLNDFQANLDLAYKYEVSLVTYEGGQHLLVNNGNFAFLSTLQRNSRMGEIYANYLLIWKNTTANSLFNHFTHTYRWSDSGFWGARNCLTDPVDATNPKAVALANYAAQSNEARPVPTGATKIDKSTNGDSSNGGSNGGSNGSSNGGTNTVIGGSSSGAICILPSLFLCVFLFFL